MIKDCTFFDHIICAPDVQLSSPVSNLAQLFFYPLAHRCETSDVIFSHDKNKFVRISLAQFRHILFELYNDFLANDFQTGDTILLAGIPGNNEMFVALMFAALASFGIRVLLPMFMENKELSEWLQLSNCRAVICPSQEIFTLEHHDREKALVKEIADICRKHDILLFDSNSDFKIQKRIHQDFVGKDFSADPLIKRLCHETDENTEALIITTSGSSGKSHMVVYEHGAYIRNCQSWQAAGLFDKSRLGGRGFTPLFMHTIGIRAFMNGIWLGEADCLINTEWFTEKPEIVRYFFLQMKPQHMTGGPAAFQLLLEMMRNFPELKKELRPHFKAIISSGAPLNPDVVKEVESALNVPVDNAFGTTETQQVLNTILRSGDRKIASLGAPLPGVKIGLKSFDQDNLYRLYIHSPFGCKHIIGEESSGTSPPDYFYLGDIVRYENEELIYEGRESKDFFKDGFGVKIPLNAVKTYYSVAHELCEHVEYFPLLGEPGLAVLLFIDEINDPSGYVQNDSVISKFCQVIQDINDHLFRKLEPFEFRHRSIKRLGVINSPVPRTIKGNVSTKLIRSEHADFIQSLTHVFASHKAVKTIKQHTSESTLFAEYLNPYVGVMLHHLKLDAVYSKAHGDLLFSTLHGQEVEILDLVGGYGTNLLGHNHPELVGAVQEFLASHRPALSNQGSIQYFAGLLAEELNLRVGDLTGKSYRVVLGSTGAEAVEIALHHACLEWRKKIEKLEQRQSHRFAGCADSLLRKVWQDNKNRCQDARLSVIVLKNAFHGHTSGARTLLESDEKRFYFTNLFHLEKIALDDQDAEWRASLDQHLGNAFITLNRVVQRNGEIVVEEFRQPTIVAAIAEPILGEGGVREVDENILAHLSTFDFPLILDEIQSGLGRSGSFLTCPSINADYYLFAKALGGGIEKISAVLIDKTRYQQKFGKYYSSTFANGELAAFTALKVLSLIRSTDVPKRALERGMRLAEKLNNLQQKYPDVIKKISGRGLMLGIHLVDFSQCDNIMLRCQQRQKLIGYLCASYLFYQHHIRLLPSLSASNVLRVEPSAFISNEEIDRFITGFAEWLAKLQNRQLYDTCRHLMDDDEFEDNKGACPPTGLLYQKVDAPAIGAEQVAFIGHFVYPADELRIIEQDFCRASDTGLRLLFNKMQVLLEMEPTVLFRKNIFHDKIHFTFIVIPLDSAGLERLHRQGKRYRIVEQIQKAVDMAARGGARFISLGGYTSILTNNGLSVTAPDGAKIITGNTLTAASGIRRIENELARRTDLKNSTLAVVGAAGNIGAVITEHFLEKSYEFERIVLFYKRKETQRQLLQLLDEFHPILTKNVETTADLFRLQECNVVIVTTNTADPIIFPHHINSASPVLIADNSVPPAISDDVEKMSNVTVLPFASYVSLPHDPDFVVSAYTPPGTAFCCAAEAMLCGLENVDIPLRGKIAKNNVDALSALAEKQGFFSDLGAIRSFKI